MTTDPSSVDGGQQEPIENSPVDAGNQTAPAASAADKAPDANSPAASSSADGSEPAKGSADANRPKSTLEAVQAVLEKSRKGTADPSTARSGEDGASAEPTDAAATEGNEGGKEGESDGEDEQVPFHNHPRWKKLLSERDGLKATNDELQSKVTQYEEADQAITRLETYLNEQHLSVDEFNRLLQIGGLMKNDPFKAFEALRPYYDKLAQITGSVLPPDLQRAVDEGYTTEELARETARARAQANVASFQSQTQQQRHQVQQQQADQTTLVNTVSNAASEWERKWASNDPDYSKKAALVKERIENAVLKGEVPRSEQEIVALCEREKKAVEATLRNLLPKPRPVSSNPVSAGGGAVSAPAPKNTLELIQRMVGATG